MPTSVRHASERRALAKDRAEIDARAVEVADMLAKLECERAEFEEHRAAAKIALEQEKAASASELKAAWHKVQDAEAKVEEAALCGAGGAGVGEQEEEAETESHDPSLAEDRADPPRAIGPELPPPTLSKQQKKRLRMKKAWGRAAYQRGKQDQNLKGSRRRAGLSGPGAWVLHTFLQIGLRSRVLLEVLACSV